MIIVPTQARDAATNSTIVYFAASDETLSGMVAVKQFAVQVDDQNVIIAPAGSEAISEMRITGSDKNDGNVDICRINLSSFDDDFTVEICRENAPDTVVFEGVHKCTEKGLGEFELLFFGANSDLHIATVHAGKTEVKFLNAASEQFNVRITSRH